MTEALPTLREELDRKTIDVLTDLTHGEAVLRLSAAELRRTASVIWTLTAGLVSADVSALAEQAAGAGQAHAMQRLFLGKGELLKVSWLVGTPGFIIHSYNATTLERKVAAMRKSEPFQRDAELRTIFSNLPGKGYIEIK